jgi:hypothetical protein
MSESGAKLTVKITEQIEIAMRSHPGPNQVYVILIGGNNMRKTTKPALEVAKLVSRFRRIMAEAQKAKVRVLLCGTIPDPRPAVDSKLKLLDEALKDLERGQGNRFLSMRATMLDAEGRVRRDLYKPNGDIHLNAAGTKIASLRIQRMLEVMLPIQAPAPVVVNAPPVVSAPLVATVVQQAPAVAKPQRVRVQAPVQDPVPAPIVNTPPVVNVQQVAAVVNAPVIVQHVAVVGQDQVESMEVDEDELLAKLFFKKYGRALPEREKEKEKDDVDKINFVIDLTDETEEIEVAAPVPVEVVVKTEPIEVAEAPENVANVANVAKLRQERRELVKARKAITAFGKTLRKSNVILEKEAPPEIVDNSNVSADASVNTVNTVNTVNPVNPIKMAEQIIADSSAEIEASQKEFVAELGDIPLDKFDNTGFRLYGPDDVEVTDEEEAMIDDI